LPDEYGPTVIIPISGVIEFGLIFYVSNLLFAGMLLSPLIVFAAARLEERASRRSDLFHVNTVIIVLSGLPLVAFAVFVDVFALLGAEQQYVLLSHRMIPLVPLVAVALLYVVLLVVGLHAKSTYAKAVGTWGALRWCGMLMAVTLLITVAGAFTLGPMRLFAGEAINVIMPQYGGATGDISHCAGVNMEYCLDLAIRAKGPQACEPKSGTYLGACCYHRAALAMDDSALCEKAMEQKDECYQDVAVASGNATLCDKIEPMQAVKACYAALRLPLPACEMMQMPAQGECYLELAITNSDPTLCAKAGYSSGDVCYSTLAERTHNFVLCTNVTNLPDRESCYSVAAGATSNATWCDRISDYWKKETCREHLFGCSAHTSCGACATWGLCGWSISQAKCLPGNQNRADDGSSSGTDWAYANEDCPG
jgi:hypothetical protein